MTSCARCSRPLKNIPDEHNGKLYGPVCLRRVRKEEKLKKNPNLEEFW